jgi:cobalamin biosynthesis protein CbiD
MVTKSVLLKIDLSGDANEYPVIRLETLLKASNEIAASGAIVHANATISCKSAESEPKKRGIWQMLEIIKRRVENDMAQKYKTFARSEFLLGVMKTANQRKRSACDVYHMML